MGILLLDRNKKTQQRQQNEAQTISRQQRLNDRRNIQLLRGLKKDYQTKQHYNSVGTGSSS